MIAIENGRNLLVHRHISLQASCWQLCEIGLFSTWHGDWFFEGGGFFFSIQWDILKFSRRHAVLVSRCLRMNLQNLSVHISRMSVLPSQHRGLGESILSFPACGLKCG
ncbi:hypothetical protein ATPR_0195 [Acetobacter tropicalis NBRC 101654]|uniref:Uncharacterized protein n=1 Tax=Acetobacter tropicalis NBRC 101654 TaxID=749388 RepID=F7V9Z6_9PROT|nr:hypothetical protein ATPR_0195 [Acetobacter tropicalis NBRC 101654]